MQTLSEDNFKVLIRVRPLNSKQKQEIDAYQQSHSKKLKGSVGNKMIKMSPAAYTFYTKFYNCNIDEIIKIHKKTHTIAVADPQYKNTDRRMRPYTYSGVYDSHDKNQTIFSQDLKEHINTVLDGYNCTILAYGITGSGKTYTVFGPSSRKCTANTASNFNTFNANTLETSQQEVQGISYLSFQYLLKEKIRLWQQQSTKVSFKLSFVQIYNQNVRDLLTGQKDSKFLNVVQDCKGNTTISDVTEINIETLQQIYQSINMGNAKRAFASTVANQYSSRSHAILQLLVEVEKANMQKTCSKLYVIDLAGSEKIQTLNCSKKMLEGANINKSLLALGNCINLLAQNSRKNAVSHIPYRDSKLTRMLKDSLGGNTKTIMIGCISPNPFLIDQTMTTLNYAMRAQGIKKKLNRNQIQAQQKPQYFCGKCKKSSKLEQNQPQQIQRQDYALKDQPLNLNLNDRMRTSIQFLIVKNVHNEKKIQQKISMLQNLYEDIIHNIRQSQSIKAFGNNHITNDPEWLKIKCVNQQQRIRLKQALFETIKSIHAQRQIIYTPSSMLSTDRLQNSMKFSGHGFINENKQNHHEMTTRDQGEIKSLSQSKSRRRKSHNKFQVVKRKPQYQCKKIDFD